MSDLAKMKIHSARLGMDFEADVYEQGECVVLTHTSLHNIYWRDIPEEDRPEVTFRPLDLSSFSGMPAMYVMVLEMKAKSLSSPITAIGEMTYLELQGTNQVTAFNPIQICLNRAFDKALICYLQIEIPGTEIKRFYSDAEIRLDGAVPLSSRTVTVPPQAESQPEEPEQAQGSPDLKPQSTNNGSAPDQMPAPAAQDIQTIQAVQPAAEAAPDMEDIDVMPPEPAAPEPQAVHEQAPAVSAAEAYAKAAAAESAASAGVAPCGAEDAGPEENTADAAGGYQKPAMPWLSRPTVPAVTGVSFNPMTRAIKVSTAKGDCTYDINTCSFVSGTLAVESKEMADALYQAASAYIRMPLYQYTGMSY